MSSFQVRGSIQIQSGLDTEIHKLYVWRLLSTYSVAALNTGHDFCNRRKIGLTKAMVKRMGLDEGRNFQLYSLVTWQMESLWKWVYLMNNSYKHYLRLDWVTVILYILKINEVFKEVYQRAGTLSRASNCSAWNKDEQRLLLFYFWGHWRQGNSKELQGFEIISVSMSLVMAWMLSKGGFHYITITIKLNEGWK